MSGEWPPKAPDLGTEFKKAHDHSYSGEELKRLYKDGQTPQQKEAISAAIRAEEEEARAAKARAEDEYQRKLGAASKAEKERLEAQRTVPTPEINMPGPGGPAESAARREQEQKRLENERRLKWVREQLGEAQQNLEHDWEQATRSEDERTE
jgi:hypothetical protein